MLKKTWKFSRKFVFYSLDVVVRAECVEKAQAGDRCLFVGTLIVVPDVGKLAGHASPKVQTAVGEKGGDKVKKFKNNSSNYICIYINLI